MARPAKASRRPRTRPTDTTAPPRYASHLRVWWALLVLSTVAAFSPALRAPYQFDDITSISANESIRALWTPAVLNPPRNTAVSGRPVVNLSLAFNYWLNERLGVDQGPYPGGRNKSLSFHAFNLVVHLACGALLFLVVRRTLAMQRYDAALAAVANSLALIVAALWLLHPIQTEAVHYVVQRTELLVSLCYLGVLYAAQRAWSADGRASLGWSVSAIVVCLIGMGCKEVMVTAPLMVALYDRAFHASSWREVARNGGRWWFYPALGATTLAIVASIAGDARFGTVGFDAGVTWYAYLYSQAWAIGHYLRLVLWPVGLTFDYGQQLVHGLRGVPGLLLLSAFALVTVAAWLRVPRWGWFGFLGAWFFLLLAPSSSVVPITTEIAAERRIYLAMAAVVVLIVLALETLRRRFATHGVTATHLRWASAACCALLAIATFMRSTTYADPLALWRDTVRKAPANPRAYHNLAAELIRQDEPRLAEADTLYRRAIELDASYVDAYTGRAAIAINLGNATRAESLLTRALTIDPGNADATQMLGRLYVRRGEPARALPYLEQYAAAFPGDNSLVAVGTTYLMLGRLDQGAAALRDALRHNPARPDAMRLLGGVLVEQGKAREALPLLEAAVRADPDASLDRALLSLALAQLGRVEESVRQAHAAVSVSNGSPRIYVLAGRAMLTAGRIADADTLFSEALRSDPSQSDAAEWLRRTRTGPR